MPTPDHRLRRLIANLSKARAIDIEAVLAQLEPSQRSRVEDLLTAYAPAAGAAKGRSQPARNEEAALLDGLSPWLRARLQAADSRKGSLGAGFEGAGAWASAMTPTARAALADCVAETPPQRRAASDPPPPLPAFLRRLLGAERLTLQGAGR